VVVTLRTSRLLLRPWRDEDVAAFAEMSADPAVMEYLLPLSDRGLSAEAWVARARAHWGEHGFGQWVVELSGEGRFIGVVGLGVVVYEAPFTPAVEVAWRLARVCWTRGYATEAAKAAVDYGFAKLGLSEIVALTVPDNQRSRRVMERLGMTHSPADDFDHPNLPEGPLKRHVLYRLRNPGTASRSSRSYSTPGCALILRPPLDRLSRVSLFDRIPFLRRDPRPSPQQALAWRWRSAQR
jgi:RimJ/RimL family protein N-acetyltransferase